MDIHLLRNTMTLSLLPPAQEEIVLGIVDTFVRFLDGESPRDVTVLIPQHFLRFAAAPEVGPRPHKPWVEYWIRLSNRTLCARVPLSAYKKHRGTDARTHR